MIKDFVIIPLFAAIIFALELALSFLPNIQLTFLLILLYTKVFGFKKTLLIIIIHVLLDNCIMGSLNIFIIIPMFLGYVFSLIIFYFTKTNNEIILAFVAGGTSIIYALVFIPFSSIFFDVNVKDYLIADIPFTIILAASSFLSVLLLFRPLYGALSEAYSKYQQSNT